MTSPTIRQSRELERQVPGQATSDGSGVRLTRVLTQDLHRRLDRDRDLPLGRANTPPGQRGQRGPAARRRRPMDDRGARHRPFRDAEQENGLMQGFQLWLNLPARDKMNAPAYRDIPAREIPIFTDADGVRVKVIAGEIGGVTGAVSKPVTEPVFRDVELPADRRSAAS